MILKFIYSLFIGILLALFIGFGVAAFYEEPKFPEPPVILKYSAAPVYTESKDSSQASELKQIQVKQDKLEKEYMKKIEIYNRNVSVIAMISAVIYLVISLLANKKLLLISDGLMLGGVFTLLYSIGRGFGSNDAKFQFVTVTVGLLIALILGYFKFIKPQKQSEKKK